MENAEQINVLVKINVENAILEIVYVKSLKIVIDAIETIVFVKKKIHRKTVDFIIKEVLSCIS